MGFESKTMHGVDWFVCSGSTVRRGFHGAAAHLLDEYARSGSGYLWGRGSGCWDALYLAERYNVRLLILETCSAKSAGTSLRALALRNLFAVVCPVVICPSGDVCPPPPNATVYRVDRAERLPAAIQALL